MREIKKRAMEATKIKKEKRSIKKERGGNITIILLKIHTCASKQHLYFSYREFSYHSCITMWGPLHYRIWLVYSNDEPPQRALGLREQASWMHPHQFHWRAFIYSQFYVHPLHGNPYSSHHIYHQAFSRLWLSSLM